jgi:hypothetical protein
MLPSEVLRQAGWYIPTSLHGTASHKAAVFAVFTPPRGPKKSQILLFYSSIVWICPVSFLINSLVAFLLLVLSTISFVDCPFDLLVC